MNPYNLFINHVVLVHPDPLKIIVKITLVPLGTCAADTTRFQKKCSYLIKVVTSTAEFQVLCDAGNARVMNKKYIDPEKLRLVLFSHSHLDHTYHAGGLIRTLIKANRVEKLPIIAHEKTIHQLKRLIKLANFGQIPKWIIWISLSIEIHSTKIIELSTEKFADLKQSGVELTIGATGAIHGANALCYRMKFKSNENTQSLDLVYSPDTRFVTPHLPEFAKNADYWLLDSTFSKKMLDHAIEITKTNPTKKPHPYLYHSSPFYSARMCQTANVKSYIVIHYFWKRFAKKYIDAENAIIDEISGEFSGKIIVSKDLQEINLLD
jgi:ribonuclease BN (tRNA processing enzyme)